ncbi:XRE family transcriptional regulator [Sediminitomix flava]|uniref:Helix-turn-helix protein n=1 Tax=Sediminitomix flava TaxID=379075 RepID=A0A315YYX1_SEDFL|nr:XRE family transcriptional regulator [Sediminitomix flava]PWJ34098.1 helix-turn-helix protein [Sediminitomix flava]
MENLATANRFSVRLREFLFNQKLTNRELELQMGLSNGMIGKIIKGQSSISIARLEKLFVAYPDLNPNWLFIGKGKMFFSEEEDEKKRINYSNAIPHFDIEATAGDTLVFEENAEMVKDFFYLPNYSDCDFAVNVWGDSMFPRLKSGDIVLCKKLSDTGFIDYGEMYLVVTNEQRLLKYIRKAEDDTCFRLVSENEHYDDIEVQKDQVLGVYAVKGRIERISF